MLEKTQERGGLPPERQDGRSDPNRRGAQGGRMATISGRGYHGGWIAGAFVLGGLVGFVAGVAAVLVLNAILVAQTSYAG